MTLGILKDILGHKLHKRKKNDFTKITLFSSDTKVKNNAAAKDKTVAKDSHAGKLFKSHCKSNTV